jgi:signal transduction histidine kinase
VRAAGAGRGRSRVVNRLVAATLLAGVAAGVIGAVLLQRSSRASELDEARDQARVLAEQYAVRLDSRIDGLVDDLTLVSTQATIIQLGAGSSSELQVVLRASDVFDELVLYDLRGRPRGAAASRFLADPTTVRADPRLATSVARAGPSVELVSGDRSIVELAVPVEDPPGRPIGVLTGRAPLDLAAAVLEDALSPDQPVPFLVDDAGQVLLHRDRNRVASAEAFPLDAVLDEPSDAASLEVDGEHRVVAAVPSERLDAVVVVEQAEEVALAPVEAARRDLVLILTATLLATVVAVILVGELLLRPLRPLTSAVARLGRGDRGARTGVGGHGEIGALAHEVDRLAEALDERDAQLAELQELSLLVGVIAERDAVAPRVLSSAVRLVHADGAALLPSDPSTLESPVLAGALPGTNELTDAAQAARRTRGPVSRVSAHGEHLLAVPLSSTEGGAAPVLTVVRRSHPFDEQDRELLTAFAAFASVAVGNANRLALEQSLAEQLQQTVDRRRDLIGTITHEFRTPLACIEGFATALVDGWSQYPDEERIELVGRIAQHAEEMEDLVARFLDFTVTERGGVVAHLEPLELRPVVDQVLEALAPLLAERDLEVSVPPLLVLADATLLRRTLTNLLSNAVKYSTPGTRVAVAAESDGTRVRIDITDQGVGMSAQEAAQAFEPFWRGGGSTTRKARGTGLGLALVAEYVRAMDGACGVSSEVGRGSTFFVTVPVASLAVSEERSEQAEEAGTA